MDSTGDINDGRMRLTIVGGFLGAGKSTWLRHQLFVETYSDPIVVVNELADNAVDDTLLHRSKSLHVLSGGCACCDQKIQMIDLLHQICNERTSSDLSTLDCQTNLIFEMSGVANPANVMSAIQDDPVLVRHILLDEIIVVVDALNGLEQLDTELLSRQQVEAADRLLITKTSQCEPQHLSELIGTLERLNPGVQIASVSYGEMIDMPSLPSVLPRELQQISSEKQIPLKSVQLKITADKTSDVEWANFTVWLSAILHKHGDVMVRVKGVVRTPAGRLLLQSVRKIMQSPEVLPVISTEKHKLDASKDNTIVMIGRGLEQEKIEKSMRAFLHCG